MIEINPLEIWMSLHERTKEYVQRVLRIQSVLQDSSPIIEESSLVQPLREMEEMANFEGSNWEISWKMR